MVQSKIFIALIILYPYLLLSCTEEYIKIVDNIEISLKAELLDIWYPRCLDFEHGGFLSDFSHDWKEDGDQDKMLVPDIYAKSIPLISYPYFSA